jgi:HEAT repeat protein
MGFPGAGHSPVLGPWVWVYRQTSQEVCPWNQDEWDAFTRGSAIRRAAYAGLRRNVAIALGNWLAASETPDPAAIGMLVAALSDEDRVVAETAARALGRAGRA